MFFSESSPKRTKASRKLAGIDRASELQASPIPPAKSYELFTFDELFSGGDRDLVFDVESYRNYFLVSFKCLRTGKVIYFEDSPEANINLETLGFVVHRFRLIGFNSRPYDLPLVLLAMQGVRAEKLKEVSDRIILEELQAYEVEKEFQLKSYHINHIDLIEVAPINASLKIYAGRLHCPRMQDLPYSPDTILTREQAVIVRDYNVNDLDNTELLWHHLKPHIELRETLSIEYKQDLRSKSDAQVAEAIITTELRKAGVTIKKPSIDAGATFKYKVPHGLSFQTEQFKQVLSVIANTTFVVGNGGSALCPPEIEALKPKLGGNVYRLGIGGLHSSEESVSYQANDQLLLIDRDVASYYPFIILNQGIYPEHLGPAFLEIYGGIVKRRLKAKREGLKAIADGLKIAINGIFGKLGNFYSAVYAPDLLTQVTVSGQLFLLMLIEMIELVGISVVSANTDGIVIHCPQSRYEDLMRVIIEWEEKTGFTTEETRYRALYSRDVNNYIAVKEDGTCKTKGVYSEVGSAQNSELSKNPECLILADAVKDYLAYGTPVEQTIFNCNDIRRFVAVRQVRGGGECESVYLGKAVRWYYASGRDNVAINYVGSGNKVAKTQGAKPCMILPERLPLDIDYQRYVSEANEILFDIGCRKRPTVGKLF